MNPSGWVWLKAQTLSAIVVMALCSVAWSLVEEHEAGLAVTQMVRIAIRNHAFNLSNLIIVSVPKKSPRCGYNVSAFSHSILPRIVL